MRTLFIRTWAVAALVVSSAVNAAAVTITRDVVIDLNSSSWFLEADKGDPPSLWVLQIVGVPVRPFTVVVGDSVVVNFSFTGGNLSITDLAADPIHDRFSLSFPTNNANIAPGIGGVATTSFAVVSGSLLANPFVRNYGYSGAFGPSVSNLTNSFVEISGGTSTFTIGSINGASSATTRALSLSVASGSSAPVPDNGSPFLLCGLGFLWGVFLGNGVQRRPAS